MTTEVQTRGTTAAASDADGGQQVADVFVVFGTTGDLAKVMRLTRCTGWRGGGCWTVRSSGWL